MFVLGQENTLFYWLFLLIGGALALALGACRSRKAGLDKRRIALATALLPLFTAFFSHLCFCLVDVEYALEGRSAWFLLAFWEKGSMLWGGLLGAALALMILGGKQRAAMLASYAPSAAWMIAVFRLCEGLAGQGYGEYWYGESPLRRFPLMVYDPYYEEWAWALFMLEALVALILFVTPLKAKPLWPGESALLLCGLYAGAQIVLESLRRDEFLRWGFVRAEQAVSAGVALIVLLCYLRRAPKGKNAQKALCMGLYALMIAACVLLEFALEGRVPFLLWLDVDGCYLMMAGACAALCGCVLWMRRLAKGKECCV